MKPRDELNASLNSRDKPMTTSPDPITPEDRLVEQIVSARTGLARLVHHDDDKVWRPATRATEALREAATTIKALTEERDEARRSGVPIAPGGPGPRREAAKKLLRDICACAAEADPESLDMPHAAECIEPLETLICERDACLHMCQQSHKFAGRDGLDIFDALAMKTAAENRAEAAEARALSVERKLEEQGASNARSARTGPVARPETSAEPSAAVDGVLREVFFTPCGMGPQGRVAHGRLYGDRKGRFVDGDDVRTSYLVFGPDADGIIRTRNSTYRIESYADTTGQSVPAREDQNALSTQPQPKPESGE